MERHGLETRRSLCELSVERWTAVCPGYFMLHVSIPPFTDNSGNADAVP